MADEDGWVGLDYNSPLVYDQNFATAGFDRTHVFQMGFVYALPWLKDAECCRHDPRRLAGERHLRRLLRARRIPSAAPTTR
jgi:hypothetical protein